MEKKVFGFLMPTPEFAKMSGGGQYNGYVAIHRSYLTDKMTYIDWFAEMDYRMHGGCTLDRMFGDCFRANEIIPVTDIDTNWSEYMVFGFDTMHLGDTWDYWTRETVSEQVLALVEWVKNEVER